ncbi:2Fe-2S iron-sulfur cluster-binding protein [Sphingomonas sp. ID0503]|uniref:2Fe-2S iron-sulfur cluster-binding protein n=1 Tax=Sphingomonas sp. ID0503 TaxID=3399691 RepID=UPI003AFB11C5
MSWLKSIFGGGGSGGSERTVTLQPSGAQFAVPKGETVLERALKEGIAYPHDCTVGTCGSCRSKLIEGKVDAITPFSYTLSREELEAGYILACQAVPKGPVVLEVDTAVADRPGAESYQGRLVESENLTHDIKRLVIELDRPMPYIAGQYVNVGWPGDTRTRSYSYAEKPEAGGRQRISTFVRRVPGGAFTGYIFDTAQPGDPLTLDGPHGNFWLREGTGPIVCIAGGSGMAPIISLLEDAAARGARRDCILLFGARGARDLYAEDRIAAIRSRWAAFFDYWPVLSEEPVAGMRDGFVTAHIAAALDRLGGGAQGYLCGPPGMIDAGVETLTAGGVPLDCIHYDKFTDASTTAAATA